MNSQDFVKFALQIAVMLGFALCFGQFMRKWKTASSVGRNDSGVSSWTDHFRSDRTWLV